MIQFKDKETQHEFIKISTTLKDILFDMSLWLERKGITLVVTDLLSEKGEDEKLQRVSRSHQEGRAADIRVRDWPAEMRDEFEKHFEKKYSHVAAISKETGLPNLILIHEYPNQGIHAHVQVRRF